MLTKRQWGYIWHWVILVVVTEGIMLYFNTHLKVIYNIIALLFFFGFLLRSLRLYPGKEEPLFLDASAVVIALVYSFVSTKFEHSNIRFLLIFVSSLIIVPHILYIISKKDI